MAEAERRSRAMASICMKESEYQADKAFGANRRLGKSFAVKVTYIGSGAYAHLVEKNWKVADEEKCSQMAHSVPCQAVIWYMALLWCP